MKFEHVIDDLMFGRVLPPANGFLVSLTMTKPPVKYEVPDWDEGKLCWRRGYLQLRGSGDSQNIFCNCPGQWGYLSNFLVGNQSLSYRGDLTILCVPLGSQFSITLSDIAIDRNVMTRGEPFSIFPPSRQTELQKILMGERPASR